MALIPIGQFSRMTRLSVKALRLYADNGLLPPAQVDSSTGYRYYAADQAVRAEIIRILRSIEMPLDQIRLVVDAKSVDDANRQLVSHREKLAERLAHQEKMLAYLESMIQKQEIHMLYEVHIENVEPRHIAAVRIRTNLSRIADDIGAGFGTLMQGLGRSGATPSGAPLTVYHDVIDQETDGDIEICVPVDPAFRGDAEVYGRRLEGGAVATTVHLGPYEKISPAYQTLAGWIADNGYEIAGPPREIYLNDPTRVAPAELETRVEYPVCPAG